MGFLDWFRRDKKEDPYVGIMKAMIEGQRDQQKELTKLVDRVLETQKDQNDTTRMLLEQYLGKGVNTSSSMDERLYKEEVDDATEWEPVLGDPFGELGIR